MLRPTPPDIVGKEIYGRPGVGSNGAVLEKAARIKQCRFVAEGQPEALVGRRQNLASAPPNLHALLHQNPRHEPTGCDRRNLLRQKPIEVKTAGVAGLEDQRFGQDLSDPIVASEHFPFGVQPRFAIQVDRQDSGGLGPGHGHPPLAFQVVLDMAVGEPPILVGERGLARLSCVEVAAFVDEEIDEGPKLVRLDPSGGHLPFIPGEARFFGSWSEFAPGGPNRDSGCYALGVASAKPD
jgi:hypothetical protein